MAELDGHLELRATASADGCTGLSHQSFRAPFHLSKPYAHDEVLQVQIVNPTAGMLEGDRLRVEIAVEDGAALLVTTPSHARVFRAKGKGGVTCRQTLRVASGGWLDWWPEPLVPHAGSRYVQETRVELGAGAALFFCDAVAPGRVARGEAWSWQSLEMKLEVTQAGRPILRERLALDGPQAGKLAQWAGASEPWLATIVLVHAAESDVLQKITQELHTPECWVGGSTLAGNGAWSARIAARDGQELRDIVSRFRTRLSEACPRLGVGLRRV